MAFHRNSSLFFSFIFISCFLLIPSSHAYQFVVGGRNGWVLKPSEDYNHWAQRMRFQVNDTLLFKYKKGSDSVLVVNKDDYDKCNVDNPIKKFDDGNSIFKFDRSGPFYFVSGNKDNCNKGQKLIIVVLAVRNKTPPSLPSPPASPSPSAAPPQGSPSPAIAPTPQGGSPSPGAKPPVLSPTPSPAANSPAVSPSPGIISPTVSPSPGIISPAPETTTPSPSSTTPSPSGSTTTPGSPAGSTSPTSGGTPAAETSPGGSPGGNSSAAPAFTPSVVLMSTVTLVIAGVLSEFLLSHN